jgi:hypothetical protein
VNGKRHAVVFFIELYGHWELLFVWLLRYGVLFFSLMFAVFR